MAMGCKECGKKMKCACGGGIKGKKYARGGAISGVAKVMLAKAKKGKTKPKN